MTYTTRLVTALSLAGLFVFSGCDSGTVDDTVIIEDLLLGTGTVAGPDSLVMIEYTARVLNGNTFVEDLQLDEPTKLNTLIEGWIEGISGMRVGGVRRLTVPPSKAFGNREIVDPGTLEVLVPPNSTVVFDIELLSMGTRPVIIEDEIVGTGAEAAVGSSVTVTYTGRLEDDTVFDSATDATFTIESGTVIEGWVEGIPGMRVGGKRLLTIPSELGYSGQTVRNSLGLVVIPSFSTLYFDVELTAVN